MWEKVCARRWYRLFITMLFKQSQQPCIEKKSILSAVCNFPSWEGKSPESETGRCLHLSLLTWSPTFIHPPFLPSTLHRTFQPLQNRLRWKPQPSFLYNLKLQYRYYSISRLYRPYGLLQIIFFLVSLKL